MRRKTIIIAVLLLAISIPAAAEQPDGCPLGAEACEAQVCPAGTTKFEDDTGYEYGEGKVEISAAGPDADWQMLAPANGVIQWVCVKAGDELFWPESEPQGGTYTTPSGQDVSHVVVYAVGPNGVRLSKFQATAPWWLRLFAWL